MSQGLGTLKSSADERRAYEASCRDARHAVTERIPAEDLARLQIESVTLSPSNLAGIEQTLARYHVTLEEFFRAQEADSE